MIRENEMTEHGVTGRPQMFVQACAITYPNPAVLFPKDLTSTGVLFVLICITGVLSESLYQRSLSEMASVFQHFATISTAWRGRRTGRSNAQAARSLQFDADGNAYPVRTRAPRCCSRTYDYTPTLAKGNHHIIGRLTFV